MGRTGNSDHVLSVVNPLCGQAAHSPNTTVCYKKQGREERLAQNDRVENTKLNSQLALLCAFLSSFKYMQKLTIVS